MNIPSEILLVYEWAEVLHSIRHYYFGNAACVQDAIQDVANHKQVEVYYLRNYYL